MFELIIFIAVWWLCGAIGYGFQIREESKNDDIRLRDFLITGILSFVGPIVLIAHLFKHIDWDMVIIKKRKSSP